MPTGYGPMTTMENTAYKSLRGVEKLKGIEEYPQWKFKTKLILEEKGLWNIVAGEEKPPTDPAQTLNYHQRAATARADICLNVENHLLYHIISCKTPKEAWDALEKVYQDKAWSNIVLRKREFATYKATEQMKMEEHIATIRKLAQNLQAVGVETQDAEVAMTMVTSLPLSYLPLIRALSAQGAKLSSEYVAAQLLQDELQRKLGQVTLEGEAVYNVNNTKASQKAGNFYTKNCNFCKKKSHFEKDCWIKDPNKAPKYCETCGKGNHSTEQCFRRKKQANLAEKIIEEDEEGVYLLDGEKGPNDVNWYIDSGATQHMTFQKELLINYQDLPTEEISLGNGSSIAAIGKGDIKLNLIVPGAEKFSTFKDVLYVPKLTKNFISPRKILEKSGIQMIWEDKCCFFKNKKGDIVAQAVCYSLLLKLLVNNKEEQLNMVATKRESLKVWHQRLGHISYQRIKQLYENRMVVGLSISTMEEETICKGCLSGKQHRQPFPKIGVNRATEVLGIIHSDICGPMPKQSLGGAMYFITFTDDKTRKTNVYFIKSKGETLAKFKIYKNWAENQCNGKIKILRTDNGGEYLSKQFQNFLNENGIVHQTTAPYAPEQNGVAERINRTLLESAKSMLYQKEMDQEFWGEAIATANYIKNRAPTKAIDGKTPEEAWSGRKPAIDHLKIFGSEAYLHIPKDNRTKLDSKTEKCILVGYYEDLKAYRLYNPRSKQLIKGRDVVFNENNGEVVIQNEKEFPVEKDKELVSEQELTIGLKTNLEPTDNLNLENQDQDLQSIQVITEKPIDQDKTAIMDNRNEVTDIVKEAPIIRRSQREKKEPERYLASAYLALEAEPQSLEEAMECKEASKWTAALKEEMESLDKNRTWTLTYLPPKRQAIKNKWIFKRKYDADGSIDKYKARLVAKGYTQKQNIDFKETFAPVTKMSTIRLLLSIAAEYDLEVEQMDVKTAFLNGELKEEIYMEQPNGFEDKNHPDKVCLLKKAIYGLKQAPKCWYEKFSEHLIKLGFKQCQSDQTVYIWRDDNDFVIISTYVDDEMIISNNKLAIKRTKRQLSEKFEMKDLGPIHYCLGIKITRDRDRRQIKMSQKNYIEEILRKFNMADCYSVTTPIDNSFVLNKEMEPQTEAEKEYMKRVPYQQAVGSLMYAMLGTRPDICTAVGIVSKYMKNPGKQHWEAIKRIFRYLRGTTDQELILNNEGNDSIIGYSDADWGGDEDTRHSTTGYVFLYGGGAFTWCSKQQNCVALSTTEAEYMSVTEATKEAIWIRTFLEELGFKQQGAMEILNDNQGCLALAKNPVQHKRMKHIDLRYHFIRQNVENGDIELTYCPTQIMLADIFTKAIPRVKYNTLKGLMGLK